MLNSSALLQFVFSGLIQGSVYALIALGFMVIYNSSGIINFAQGEFVMLGGMTAVTLYNLGLPLPLAILLAVLVVTAFGMVFQHLAIRPMKKATSFSLIMVTIGASIFIRGLAMLVWGKDTFALPLFLTGPPLVIGGAVMIPHSLIVLGAAILLMLALHLFFKRTMIGQAMRACAVNSRGAALCGIKPEVTVRLAYGISAGLAAISGIYYRPNQPDQLRCWHYAGAERVCGRDHWRLELLRGDDLRGVFIGHYRGSGGRADLLTI